MWTASLESGSLPGPLVFYEQIFKRVVPAVPSKNGVTLGRQRSHSNSKMKISAPLRHFCTFSPKFPVTKFSVLCEGGLCNWSADYPSPIFSKTGGARVPQPLVLKFWKKYWTCTSTLCSSRPSFVAESSTVPEIFDGEFLGNSPFFPEFPK